MHAHMQSCMMRVPSSPIVCTECIYRYGGCIHTSLCATDAYLYIIHTSGRARVCIREGVA